MTLPPIQLGTKIVWFVVFNLNNKYSADWSRPIGENYFSTTTPSDLSPPHILIWDRVGRMKENFYANFYRLSSISSPAIVLGKGKAKKNMVAWRGEYLYSHQVIVIWSVMRSAD